MTYNTPTDEEMVYLASIKDMKRFGMNDRKVLYGTYNRIFNTKIAVSSCGSCLAKRHKHLMEVYNKEKDRNNG